jgi:hypothetical protein
MHFMWGCSRGVCKGYPISGVQAGWGWNNARGVSSIEQEIYGRVEVRCSSPGVMCIQGA